MDVDGISIAEARRIEDQAIVSGQVNEAGFLILKTKGGTETNAGSVRTPPVPLFHSWPIGSLYMSELSENPAVKLGGGTWSRHANGRVLVGVDETQNDTFGPGKTGGANTVTLTSDQMPSHAHTASASTDAQGEHAHVYGRTAVGSLKQRGSGSLSTQEGGNMNPDTTSAAGSHAHNVGVTVNPNGGGQPHSNLQPYLAVYIWKRTA